MAKNSRKLETQTPSPRVKPQHRQVASRLRRPSDEPLAAIEAPASPAISGNTWPYLTHPELWVRLQQNLPGLEHSFYLTKPALLVPPRSIETIEGADL